MLAEFVQKILSLSDVQILTLDGRRYSDKAVHPVKKPAPTPLKIATLTGLVEYVEEFMASDVIGARAVAFHVVSHREVHLISDLDPDWNERWTVAVAKTQDAPNGNEVGFNFGGWMDVEPFIIGLNAHFFHEGQRNEVLTLISGLSAESSTNCNDNGVSQSVSVRKGVHLMGMTKVPNPVLLAPRRGFVELEPQPASFVLRVRPRGEGELPLCALFEADGGAWQLPARRAIRDWLKAALPEIPVIS